MYKNEELSHYFVKVFDAILNEESKNLKDMGLKEITLNELHVLIKIRDLELLNIELTPKNLMKELNITKGTLSTVTNRLITKKYLISKKDQNDARKIYFVLKEKANYAIQLHDEWHNKLIESVVEEMTEEEIKLITKLLYVIDNKMLQNNWSDNE